MTVAKLRAEAKIIGTADLKHIMHYATTSTLVVFIPTASC